MKLKDQGFSFVITLVVLLVIAAAGFAGWKVWDNTRTATRTDKAQTQTPKPPKASSEVPEGFVEFTSKEAGVRFAYPKAWGEAVVQSGPETPHVIRGSEYTITFSANSAVTAGSKSRDWEHGPQGHDGAFYAGQFVTETYDSLVKSEGEQTGFAAVTHVNTPSAYIISTSFGWMGCNGVGELWVHDFEKSAKYPGIAFIYINKQMDYSAQNKELGITPEDICSDKNYAKYISKENAETFKKIDATIQRL